MYGHLKNGGKWSFRELDFTDFTAIPFLESKQKAGFSEKGGVHSDPWSFQQRGWTLGNYGKKHHLYRMGPSDVNVGLETMK